MEEARRYAQGEKFKLITSYEVEPKMTLCLNNENIKNLKHFLPQDKFQFNEALEKEFGSIMVQELCKKAVIYDSVLCKGEVEGGEQLIIPHHSFLSPEPRSFFVSLWFFSHSIGQQFLDYLRERNYSVLKEGGWYEFEAPFYEVEWVTELINFSLATQSPNVESVDFVHRNIREYEE